METLECARVVEVLLRLTDGSIPAPPFDLVMARAERCTFRDKSGVLVTPLQQQPSQQPSHYHIHLDTFIWIVHEQLSQILFHMCLQIFYQNLLSFIINTSNCFLD